MLRTFRALPTEPRARAMKGRDYLWCLANELLDREAELERLCPECRQKALSAPCPACGRERAAWGEGAENAFFDRARFERMRGGEGS